MTPSTFFIQNMKKKIQQLKKNNIPQKNPQKLHFRVIL